MPHVSMLPFSSPDELKIKERDNLERFGVDLDKCLLKIEMYLSGALSHEHLSGFVELKRAELVDSLTRLRNTYKPDILIQNMVSQLTPSSSDTNNNNNNQRSNRSSLSSPILEGEIQSELRKINCLCSQVQRLTVVPRSSYINSARSRSYSRSLLDRLVKTQGNPRYVYQHELLVKSYGGWLHVDDEHKFYGVVSDCLFVIFISDLSDKSVMTLSLNQCLAQPSSSSDENALTINTAEDVLYFYTESQEQTTDWITWINVGAQLSMSDLLNSYTSDRSRHIDIETQTDESYLSDHTYVQMRRTATHHKQLSTSTHSSISVEPEDDDHSSAERVQASREIGNSRTQATKQPSVMEKTAKLRQQTPLIDQNCHRAFSIGYDFEHNCGTDRQYYRTDLHHGERMRKCHSFSEALVNTNRRDPRGPLRTSGYLDQPDFKDYDLNKPRKSNSFQERPRLGVKIATRTSLLSSSKSDHLSITQSKSSVNSSAVLTRHIDMPSGSFTPALAASQKQLKRTSSHLAFNTNVLQSNDMAEICEMQGYLQCKKMIKWHTYYCVIYRGVFSLFKDTSSANPELQYQLKNCTITPVDEKKVKRSFAFKITTTDSSGRSAYLAAISDRDLYDWYNSFNGYIRGALDLPISEKDSDEDISQRSLPIVPDSIPFRDSREIQPSGSPGRPSSEGRLGSDGRPSSEGRPSSDGQPSSEPTYEDAASYQRSLTENQRSSSRDGSSSDCVSQDLDQLDSNMSVNENDAMSYEDRMNTTAMTDELAYRSPEGSSGDDSSDEGKRMERGDSRNKSEQQRRQLLERMRREKERIERSIESQDRKNQEEMETEILKNHTRLKQRRVSTQLKYDFLEKQLGGQQDAVVEKKGSGGFLRSSKTAKSEKLPRSTSSMYENDEHIRKQMDELRARLDSLDKGLNDTHQRRDGRNLLTVYKTPSDPALSSASTHHVDPLSHQKLKGLESIIETLDNQVTYASNNNTVKCTRPHSVAVCQNNSEYHTTPESKSPREDSDKKPGTTPTIRAETLALINEFEAMTKEFLTRRSSINYQHD